MSQRVLDGDCPRIKDVVLQMHVFMVMPLERTQVQTERGQFVVQEKFIGEVAEGMNPIAKVFVFDDLAKNTLADPGVGSPGRGRRSRVLEAFYNRKEILLFGGRVFDQRLGKRELQLSHAPQ